MKVLVLGGTGAMGTPLVELLGRCGNDVSVTTRRERKPAGSVRYMTGDAHDAGFIKGIMKPGGYDAVFDFMIYGSAELRERLPMLLEGTGQYFFFSSARVFAGGRPGEPITEESPRLLDVCVDRQYLESDEYALAKAREEDLLRKSGGKNWTIIRPYITYNDRRLQLGVYEKEGWLRRALDGRTVVLPWDIAARTTTMTYGQDVASALVKLMGNPRAYGEDFNIVTSECATWRQVLEIYSDVLEEERGIRPRVLFQEDSSSLQRIWNQAQIRYDRLYDRRFDSSKLLGACGDLGFTGLKDGLGRCLGRFLQEPEWLGMDWRYEAWADRHAGERARLKDISGWRDRMRYVKWRYLKRDR